MSEKRKVFLVAASVTLAISAGVLAASASRLRFSRAASHPPGGFAATADLNHDGKSDLVTGASDLPGGSTVLLARRGGRFSRPRDLGFDGSACCMEMADLTGDRKPDVVGVSYPAEIAVRLGDGRGAFPRRRTFPIPVASGDALWSVEVGDFNRDRKRDLVVVEAAALGDTGREGSQRPGVWVLLGDGAGAFSTMRHRRAADGLLDMAVADFNRDRRPDLAVAAGYNPTLVSVLLGDGRGGLTSAGRKRVANGGVLEVGDFNRDRRPDIAATSQVDVEKPGYVRLLLGNGRGGLKRARKFRVGCDPESLASADFNRDRRADLAVASAGMATTPPCFGDLRVLLGNGRGGFSTGIRFGRREYFQQAVIGDFNRDRKPDLAAGAYRLPRGVGPPVSKSWVLLNTTGR